MTNRGKQIVLVTEKWLQSIGLSTNIEILFCGNYARKPNSRFGTVWDLVGWDKNGRFVAVEVELKFSWEAVDQAAAVLPACNEVYLAVYDRGLRFAIDIWEEINRDYGIGLVSISLQEGCKILFKAKNIFPVRKGMMSEMLRISKLLPREGIEPGQRRKIDLNGWRWKKSKKLKSHWTFLKTVV